tara:strand:- start:495 stop:1061 length:567 start_codon:yes stop_codon:yes gene_type:complete
MHSTFQKAWMDKDQNMVKDAAQKIFQLAENKNSTLQSIIRDFRKNYSISSPLHLSEVSDIQSLTIAIQYYNKQILKYNFLNQFPYTLSSKELQHLISIQLSLFLYNNEQKIDFYIFCLSLAKIAELAAEALRHLAVHQVNRKLIADARGIAPLVALLNSGTDVQKEQAAGALRNLSCDNSDNQKAFFL